MYERGQFSRDSKGPARQILMSGECAAFLGVCCAALYCSFIINFHCIVNLHVLTSEIEMVFSWTRVKPVYGSNIPWQLTTAGRPN